MEILADNFVIFAVKNVKSGSQVWPVCIAPEFVELPTLNEIKKWFPENITSQIENETEFKIADMLIDFTIFETVLRGSFGEVKGFPSEFGLDKSSPNSSPLGEEFKITGMCNDESQEKEHEFSIVLSRSKFERNLCKMFEFYKDKKFTMCLEGIEYTYNIEELQKLTEK